MKEKIREILRKNGFPRCGFVDFSSVRRQKTNSFPSEEKIKTVIITSVPYFFKRRDGQNLARFAVIKDYHATVPMMMEKAVSDLKREFPDSFFLSATDNSPIDEKRAAVLSGLGKYGKNSLFYDGEYGSFLFLCELLTDLEIEADGTDEKEIFALRCKDCEICKKACPAGAIGENGIIPERCISFIGQKKGALSDGEQALLKRSPFIWGCDVCQEVCPMNRDVKEASLDRFEPIFSLKKEDIEPLSDSEFKERYKDRAFCWRGRQTILRNILIKEEE